MSKEIDMKKDGTLSNVERVPGKGFAATVSDEFVEHMMGSDKSNCEFKRGDRVIKVTYDPGDFHQIGTKGIVIGSIYEKTLGEAYLVQFDGDEHACFTIKYKIKLDV